VSVNRLFTATLAAALLACASTSALRAAQAPQAAAPIAPATPATADDLAGRAALDQVCTWCHDTTMITGGTRTVAEWDDVLERMAANGASASEEQANQIRAYLLRNFGRVNVNRAPARDLIPVLNVEPAVADAVVMYRAEQGGFTNVDDLKKVPGIDAARLDARKDRLMF
jgi:competence protein ComEA